MKSIKITGCVLLLLILSFAEGRAQSVRPNQMYGLPDGKGDTLYRIDFAPIVVHGREYSGRIYRNRDRLSNAVLITYPIALEAKRKLDEMQRHIATLKNERERKEYTKETEKELIKQYTPVLRRMSVYQGFILLKLIDRETGDTGYTLVKELRGGVPAVFWQGVARLFGTNLKVRYDPEGEDAVLEEYVQLYQQGLLR